MQRKTPDVAENPPNTQYCMDKSNMRYFRKGDRLQRQSSYLEISSLTGEIETFTPSKEIGKGSYGSVRLFSSMQNPHKLLAVKKLCLSKDNSATNCSPSYNKLLEADMNQEVEFFALAHPDKSPCLLKHYHDDDDEYDYRLVLPYLPGVTVEEFFLKKNIAAENFALACLKIIASVTHLHQRGIFHGDIHAKNILIEQNNIIEYGIESFDVHLIDFNYAGKLTAKTAGLYYEDILYEDIDYQTVDALHLRALLRRHMPALQAESKYFISLWDFINSKGEITSSNALNDLSLQLEQELAKWHNIHGELVKPTQALK